jgi:hypothetical protein
MLDDAHACFLTADTALDDAAAWLQSDWKPLGSPLTDVQASRRRRLREAIVAAKRALNERPGMVTDEEVRADFLNMPFRYWICPVEGHSDSRLDGDGVPAGTVHWEGDVAKCTWPACGRTSAMTDEEKPE